MSNFQLPTGDFNELMYGYMINAVSGRKHPVGASTYGAVAGDACYRVQYMLQDQKIGMYMYVPLRLVFMSQIFGELMGIPIKYAVMRWIMKTKGRSISKSNTIGVQYVLVGPARMFKEHIFAPLPWAFLIGAVLPIILFLLHRYFPRARLDLWNVTIFFSSLNTLYGNLSTGYTSAFIAGFIVMYGYIVATPSCGRGIIT
ncbi:OPT oligopeptide transporter protein-domain-containing protein [Delphinella strobiligena]|nr:OPT oligopeptide transporter protein-domain-containing protein [Delphinella strobiligena]